MRDGKGKRGGEKTGMEKGMERWEQNDMRQGERKEDAGCFICAKSYYFFLFLSCEFNVLSLL